MGAEASTSRRILEDGAPHPPLLKLEETDEDLGENDIVEVIDRVFVSGLKGALNAPMLHEQGVTHVLNCNHYDDCPHAYRANEFSYMMLNLPQPSADGRGVDLRGNTSNFHRSNQFIIEGRRNGGVLVHCRNGRATAPALVAAFLIGKKKLSARDAVQSVMDRHPPTLVEGDFRNQLFDYQVSLTSPANGIPYEEQPSTRASKPPEIAVKQRPVSFGNAPRQPQPQPQQPQPQQLQSHQPALEPPSRQVPQAHLENLAEDAEQRRGTLPVEVPSAGHAGGSASLHSPEPPGRPSRSSFRSLRGREERLQAVEVPEKHSMDLGSSAKGGSQESAAAQEAGRDLGETSSLDEAESAAPPSIPRAEDTAGTGSFDEPASPRGGADEASRQAMEEVPTPEAALSAHGGDASGELDPTSDAGHQWGDDELLHDQNVLRQRASNRFRHVQYEGEWDDHEYWGRTDGTAASHAQHPEDSSPTTPPPRDGSGSLDAAGNVRALPVPQDAQPWQPPSALAEQGAPSSASDGACQNPASSLTADSCDCGAVAAARSASASSASSDADDDAMMAEYWSRGAGSGATSTARSLLAEPMLAAFASPPPAAVPLTSQRLHC